jgi:hypothetical protein
MYGSAPAIHQVYTQSLPTAKIISNDGTFSQTPFEPGSGHISKELSRSASNYCGINTKTYPNLVNSDVSLGYKILPLLNSTRFVPDTSSLNGDAFFASGTGQTRNMILIPAAGTLNLPAFIQNLTGFPNDLWIVNYKKVNGLNQTENLILGTVVEANQQMSIPPPIGLTSKVINISKYVVE